jgi:periplasmic protein CpxP/Spy
MKKTIILSAAMAFATLGAFAQEAGTATPHPVKMQGTAEDRAKDQTDKINATVQLSADQYAKVKELIKKSIAQKDALRNSSAEGEDKKAKFKALREQEQAQLKAILTPEQFGKLEAARKEHQGQKPE